MSDNMQIWDQVCTTDPKYTKPGRRYGGFQVTAINANWQCKVATKLWGPYGGSWGLRNFIWSDRHTTVYEDARGKRLSQPKEVLTIILQAEFYYPNGAFDVCNDYVFRVDGDTYKKLQTDTLTKALSYLGFSADVFMNQFDGKYAEPPRQPKTERYPPEVQEALDKPHAVLEEDTYSKAAKAIRAASGNPKRLNDFLPSIKQRTEQGLLTPEQEEALCILTMIHARTWKVQDILGRIAAAEQEKTIPHRTSLLLAEELKSLEKSSKRPSPTQTATA